MSGAGGKRATSHAEAHIGIKGGVGRSGAALQGVVVSYQQDGTEVGRQEARRIRDGLTSNAAEVEAIVVAMHEFDRPVRRVVVYTDSQWIADRLNRYLREWSAAGGVPDKDKFHWQWAAVLEQAAASCIGVSDLSGVHVGTKASHPLLDRAKALAHATLPADPTTWTPEQRQEGQARSAWARAQNKARREAEVNRRVREAVERDRS